MIPFRMMTSVSSRIPAGVLVQTVAPRKITFSFVGIEEYPKSPKGKVSGTSGRVGGFTGGFAGGFSVDLSAVFSSLATFTASA